MDTILITGANRGIGLELSRRYATDGWRVHACCRRPKAATELRQLAGRRPQLRIHPLDVTEPDQIARLSRDLKGESIDILLNNAGIAGPRGVGFGQFGAAEKEAWLQVLTTNSIAPLLVAQGLLEQVGRSRCKVIATISSLMGSIADNSSGGMVIYRSSKTAVNQVMKCLAIELQPQGITVVVLHPGWVRTDMGGPEAPLEPAESARGLQRVLNRLTPAQSGHFLNYDGTEIPW